MYRPLIAVAALGVVLAACGGSGGDGVASLDEPSDGGLGEETNIAAEPSGEESILAFAQCMRDNGVEDFEDPGFNADGSLEFRGGPRAFGDVDRQTLRSAFEACQDHLEGFAFGRGSVDRSEIEDRLVDFAACMRDPNRGNLSDFPDPDFSNFGPGGGGPFGEEGLDFDDPAVQAALEACQDVFGGFRGGRGGRGGPGGRGPGTDNDGTSA